MIQNLVQAIATLLQNNLTGVTIKSTAIDTPPAGQLPTIAVYPAKLLVNQGFRDRPSEISPRVLPAAHTIALSQKRGPYPLDHTPLPGTLLIQTAGAGDTSQPLAEGTDFTIDTQAVPATLTVTFGAVVKRNSPIALTYQFQGAILTQSIEQELLIDIYAADPASAEQWASLSNAIILASHGELLTMYNMLNKTQYQAKDFTSVHTIDQIQLVAGTDTATATLGKAQLTFRVTGQLQLIKEIRDGVNVIKEIPLTANLG
jgi:hypothetical protein